MSRVVSFIVLLVILLAIAALFAVVMAGFVLPLFVALILAVIFQPLHRWFVAKCHGRFRLASALTTGAIALIVLLPLSVLFAMAVLEGVAIYRGLQARSARLPRPIERKVEAESGKGERAEDSLTDAFIDPRALAEAVVRVGEHLDLTLSADNVEQTIRKTLDAWLGPLALGTARLSGSLLLFLGVTVISTYYFLADGPWMIRKIMRFSPLDDRYEEQLFEEFVRITRAVVVATLLSAVVQGLLAGLGFTIVGLPAVFLLMVLTMFLAMIPFVGAAAVWAPVCAWLFFFADPPRKGAAIFLAIYGAGVVSMADNVIKPLVLHGRSNIHPLLALLSVIGGARALGPIGIFVGPMVVAFFHALLNMFHSELERMGGEQPAEPKPPKEPPSAKPPPAPPSEAEKQQPPAKEQTGHEPPAESPPPAGQQPDAKAES